MSGWRHVWVDGDACMGHEGKFLCGCTTPTPDPASPCPDCPPDNPDRPWVYHRCDRCGQFTEFCTCTRCTCGHPIEAVS